MSKKKAQPVVEEVEDRNYASAEEMDSDELDGDLNLSDCEDNAREYRAENVKRKAKKKAVIGDRKYR